LSASAESLKQIGNDHLDRKEYTKAIDAYSRALLIAPDAPLLYANRAAGKNFCRLN
jgi:tetratricopeptide (TPR) repeat protein